MSIKIYLLKSSVVEQLLQDEHKKTRMEMTLTNSLLAINILQVLMIFHQVHVTFKKPGYFETVNQMFGEKDGGHPIFPAAEPTPEPEQIFLKYSLMIGLSLLVVFMGSIAQIEMLNQYVHNVVNETN